MKHSYHAILAGLLTCFVYTAPVAAQETQTFALGTTSTKESAEGAAADKFAELVSAKSDGRLQIQVNYQSLGVEAELAQAVIQGSVDLGTMSNGSSARFTDAYLVYDLPFLFKSYENMLESLTGPIGRKAISRFEQDTGLKFLMPISLGSGRDIQTRDKPLRTPADIQGLKIRVIASPIDLAVFRAWGANPTPMDYGQVYTALQQGAIDGEQISIGAVLSAKHYEVVQHNIRLDYQSIFTQLFMNQARFDALAPEDQAVFMEAAEETRQFVNDYSAKLRDRAITELGKQGVNVYTPTPSEYEQWAAVREEVWADVAGELGDRIDMDDARELYAAQE